MAGRLPAHSTGAIYIGRFGPKKTPQSSSYARAEDITLIKAVARGLAELERIEEIE